MIPEKKINEELLGILVQVQPGTSILELISTYLVVCYRRNNFNKTHTARELNISLRSLRHKINHNTVGFGFVIKENKDE